MQKFLDECKKILRALIAKENWAYSLFSIFLWFILVFLIAGEYIPNFTPIAGKVALTDIRAYRDFTKIDNVATEKARLDAAKMVPVIYSKNDMITEKSISEIDNFFKELQNLRSSGAFKTDSFSLERYRSSLPLKPSTKTLSLLLKADLNFLDVIFKPLVRTVVRQIMDGGVSNENYMKSAERIHDFVALQSIPDQYKLAAEEIAELSIKINLMQDWRAVKNEQAKRMREVAPILNYISKGEMIVRRGEVITPKQVEIISAMDAYRRDFSIRGFIASAIVITMLFLLLFYFIDLFVDKNMRNKRILAILGAVFVITAVTCRITTNINIEGLSADQTSYFAPVASASIIIYFLAGAKISLLMTVLLSVLAAAFSHSNATGIISILTGITAILSFANIVRRFEMLRGSIIVIVVNSVLAWAITILNPIVSTVSFSSFILGALNGLISCMLAIGGMVLIESMFPVVTNIKLLDIANPMEPLMQRLMTEAPGTHVHSILVANLAEAGAMAIGANALLARVGAFYHDIGKLKRPSLFIENQFGMFNPHDKLRPTLSSLVVISHVKYGAELGREYHLPESVLDIIAQHHGTSLVSYFHYQAKKQGLAVYDGDFSYPGPKPQTKEAAIVMMADSIEAAVRSLQNRSSIGIESLIDKIIDKMLKNGQFDECAISFKDIKILKRVFLKCIAGLYHTRIDYPEKLVKKR